MSLKITNLRLKPRLPGANELNCDVYVSVVPGPYRDISNLLEFIQPWMDHWYKMEIR